MRFNILIMNRSFSSSVSLVFSISLLSISPQTVSTFYQSIPDENPNSFGYPGKILVKSNIDLDFLKIPDSEAKVLVYVREVILG